MEAAIILAKCPKRKIAYGMRTQKMNDGDWWRTWAFPINEKRAHSEGYDETQVLGNLFATAEYPGCPYCGAKGFVQCNKCKKIACYSGEKSLICPWCGNLMDNITTATEKFSLSGGDI